MIPAMTGYGFSLLNPFILFRADGASGTGSTTLLRSDEEVDNGDRGEWFRCRFCKARITTPARMIEVAGSHCHVFTNPQGKVFEIGCFSGAPGCINHGSPTMECTWFTGCSWRFSLCGTCSAHLGWHYQSALSGSFWGLILTNLKEP